MTSSDMARHAVDAGLLDRAGVEVVAEAWREWAQARDGWFAVLHCEVLARVPGEPG